MGLGHVMVCDVTLVCARCVATCWKVSVTFCAFTSNHHLKKIETKVTRRPEKVDVRLKIKKIDLKKIETKVTGSKSRSYNVHFGCTKSVTKQPTWKFKWPKISKFAQTSFVPSKWNLEKRVLFWFHKLAVQNMNGPISPKTIQMYFKMKVACFLWKKIFYSQMFW